MENTQRCASGYKIFGQEIIGAFTFTNYRLVTVCLGLLNAALLIVAIVIGIKCANVKEGSLNASHLAVTSELDYLRSNHSDLTKAEEEANRALETARKNHTQLKVKIEQLKAINDDYQRQYVALRKEKGILQSDVSSLEGTCGRCPPGWILLNSSCYFLSSTVSPTVRKTWSDSRDDCISRGSDLVVIDDQEEQKFVSVVIENASKGRNVWENGFWIGLTDAGEEGTWLWINNVTEVEQRYWKDGEPNDMGRAGEDCALVFPSPSNPWKTRNDANCQQHQTLWICEKTSDYNKLTDTHLTLDDTKAISKEPVRNLNSSKTAEENIKSAKKQLASELSLQKETKWEFEYQTKRSTEYQKKIDKMTTDIMMLRSNLPLISERSVTGAKAKDLEVPQSDAAPLTVELNYLRNRSGIIQAKLDAQAKLVKERNNHVELKLQVKQKKALTDTLQRRIETLQIEKTSLQSNKTALEKSCGRCPPGWILLKLSCYYFSRNEMASRKNWSDSRADCLSKKADLLVINSLEEQQLISENFVRQTGGVSWWEGGYWMGLTDVATEGTWVWVNNVTEVSPLYWRSGQPSHSGPLRGNCGAFLHYTDNLKTWFNANCTDTLLNWICEKELKETFLILTAKMGDGENSGGFFESTYNKLVSQEDVRVDERPFYSTQGRQRVSMSKLRSASSVNHYKCLAVGLAALATFLLAVNIGLGVYYSKLTDGKHLITDIGSEMAKVRANYDSAIQARDEAKKQLEKELSEQQITKWELDHQTRRNRDYEKQADKIQTDLAALRSHIPMIKEGCRHCLPGWTFMNSVCYFFAFPDSLSRRSWPDARQFCKKQGGDLAVMNTREKHLAAMELINSYHDHTRNIYNSGFWIGLRDSEEEGTWRWLDGTSMADGYWNDGEPNNQNNEDCAAMYPRINPFKGWNDAPCSYGLKWICEMASRSIG
ncbi:uncharacterized protein LOC125023800 [Mugil cephalus]|uniref:uncharacterized protein LOC125023800 n=1 Tax=Mugil cephalus TaxID=48193 RepID=UPI001FB79487|nr:uncharacterized protein LOC125023800 [Mugil cephalus]